MKTYRVKVKQVYIETMFVEAESEDDAMYNLCGAMIVELLIVNTNQQRQRL